MIAEWICILETGFDSKSSTYAYNLAGELTSQTEAQGDAAALAGSGQRFDLADVIGT